MPPQRLYNVHMPDLIQAIQSKANAAVFVPNPLDFGMLFSGLNQESQRVLRNDFDVHGNGFTMSAHRYLISGPSLNAATRAAVDRLGVSIRNNLAGISGGLLESVRYELTLSLTGAIYGP